MKHTPLRTRGLVRCPVLVWTWAAAMVWLGGQVVAQTRLPAVPYVAAWNGADQSVVVAPGDANQPPLSNSPPVGVPDWSYGAVPAPSQEATPAYPSQPSPALSPWDTTPPPPSYSPAPYSMSPSGGGESRGRFLGGADLLFIRPTFSEAIAFVRGTQTFPVAMQTQVVPIEFDYDPAFRVFLGYQLPDTDVSLLFSYTNLAADTAVNGTLGNPGEFIVDPFGNLVGTVRVLDPADARGLGTVVSQGPFVGDAIRTNTRVELQVFDLDLTAPLPVGPSCLQCAYRFGVRMADVRQSYDSQIDAGGLTIARGDYAVDFFGAGPRIGLEGNWIWGAQGRLMLFGNVNGSLLVGNYDVVFTNSPLPGLAYSQGENGRRTIPVLESELGLKFRASNALQLSAGWNFQSWWDLGASGGTFGGWFTGADDANIMSFDGLFLRAELAY